MSTQEITKLQLAALKEECPVNHYFSEGVYIRELILPKGLIAVGKEHKTKHLNTILKGECDVMINGVIKRFKGPCTFESLAGSQKTVYIYEDTIWQTIHVNEDNEKDIEMLEERYINSDGEQALAMKAMVDNMIKESTKCLG